MKSLTGTLLAAQKKARGKPYLQVTFKDLRIDETRLVWSELYSGAEGDHPVAMCVAGDDSIVRVYESGGILYRQRVTDATQSSEWETWINTGWLHKAGYQISLVASAAYVWLFYADSNGNALHVRESSDYGATFGSSANVYVGTGGYAIESCAGAAPNGAEPWVFFSYGDTAGLQTDLYVCKRSAGVWGAPSSWGKTSVHRVKGLSVFRISGTDYNMLYCGEDAGVISYVWKLWSVCYGDGVDQGSGTWADPVELEVTDEGTDSEYSWPSLVLMDVDRAFLTISFTGTNAFDRVHRIRAVSGSTYMTKNWTDPAPFRGEGGLYGTVLAYVYGGDGYVYAACSSRAWRADASGESNVSFTNRVKKYRLVDRWTGYKGGGVSIDVGELVAPELHGELWLDNADGALNALGSGSYAVVKRGSQVVISRGYVTAGGNETSDWPYLWVEDYEHVVDFRGRSYVVFYLVGAWNILSAMGARRQYHWEDDEESVFAIAERLMGLAGFEVVEGGEASSELGTVEPWVLVHPGEDLRGAVLAVLSKVPDFVYFQGATGYLKELADDEASDYTYGGAGNHVIISGRYGRRSPSYDHIEVFAGIDLFGDDLDYAEIDLVGHRLQKIFDYGYDSDAECGDRAGAQVRKHLATTRRGEVVTLPNVGLQLLDVVTLSDDRCGVSSEIYRVRGIVEVYDTTKPPMVFKQTVALGAR